MIVSRSEHRALIVPAESDRVISADCWAAGSRPTKGSIRNLGTMNGVSYFPSPENYQRNVTDAAAWGNAHQAMLDAIFDAFMSGADWPDINELQRDLDRRGASIDLYGELREMPPSLGGGRSPSPAHLTVRGLHQVPRARPLLLNYMRVIRVAVDRYHSEESNPTVTDKDLTALGITGHDAVLVSQVVIGEGWPFGGGHGDAHGSWSRDVGRDLRYVAGAETRGDRARGAIRPRAAHAPRARPHTQARPAIAEVRAARPRALQALPRKHARHQRRARPQSALLLRHPPRQPIIPAERVEQQLADFLTSFAPSKATQTEILRRLSNPTATSEDSQTTKRRRAGGAPATNARPLRTRRPAPRRVRRPPRGDQRRAIRAHARPDPRP
jgi:hypothetical protein